MGSVIDQLVKFFQQANDTPFGARRWLKDNKMEVYVRYAVHNLDDKRGINTLDIANIIVFEPGKGTGSNFIEQAHLINPWAATYIESVSVKRFAEFLKRKGWILTAESRISRDGPYGSYYMSTVHADSAIHK